MSKQKKSGNEAAPNNASHNNELDQYLRERFNITIYDQLTENCPDLIAPLDFFKLLYSEFEFFKRHAGNYRIVKEHFSNIELEDYTKEYLLCKLMELINTTFPAQEYANTVIQQSSKVVEQQWQILNDRLFVFQVEETRSFDFDMIKKHLDTLPSSNEKIKYLIEAQTDFKQKRSDLGPKFGEYNFLEKCDLEIEKLRKFIQYDQGTPEKDFSEYFIGKTAWKEIAYLYNTQQQYQHKQDLIAVFWNSYINYQHKFEVYFRETGIVPVDYFHQLTYEFRQHFPKEGRIIGINYFDDLIDLLLEKYQPDIYENTIQETYKKEHAAFNDGISKHRHPENYINQFLTDLSAKMVRIQNRHGFLDLRQQVIELFESDKSLTEFEAVKQLAKQYSWDIYRVMHFLAKYNALSKVYDEISMEKKSGKNLEKASENDKKMPRKTEKNTESPVEQGFSGFEGANDNLNQIFKIADKKGAKIDVIRVLNAVYELKLIQLKDGQIPAKGKFMKEMGLYLGIDLSNYEVDLSQAFNNTSLEANLKVFEEMRQITHNSHYMGNKKK